MIPKTDVLIAGAGPAGATAALVLAGAGRRVLLVDGVDTGRRIGESLPGGAHPLLRDLGLLKLVEGGPHLPCVGNLSAWGSSELLPFDFIRNPHGLGWHLDRARFDADLRAAACAAGAGRTRNKVLAVARGPAGWRVRLEEGEVEAGRVIDATGRRAAVARMLGAIRSRDTRLVVLYAWAVTKPGEADNRTLVESVPEGWWYTARLPDSARVVVLHVGADEATRVLHEPGAWEARIARTIHLRAILQGARFSGPPRATEACGARLDRFGDEGWLAAGDAALSFDPLSSQGILTSLYCGMKAARALIAEQAGESDAFEAYASRLELIRSAYLRQYLHAYAGERRWLDQDFWMRRAPAEASAAFPNAGKTDAGIGQNRYRRTGPEAGPGRIGEGSILFPTSADYLCFLPWNHRTIGAHGQSPASATSPARIGSACWDPSGALAQPGAPGNAVDRRRFSEPTCAARLTLCHT